MSTVEDIDDIAVVRLHGDGQRYTRNRRHLVHLLAESNGPLTIPEILQQRGGLAQSSVYRNLVVLEEAGLVQKIVTSDEWARYELDESLSGHHHHMICTVCGLVRDFTVSARIERSVTDTLKKVAEETGFSVAHHRLDLVGVCDGCSA